MKLAHRCGGLATTCVYNADTGSLIFCSLPIFQLLVLRQMTITIQLTKISAAAALI